MQYFLTFHLARILSNFWFFLEKYTCHINSSSHRYSTEHKLVKRHSKICQRALMATYIGDIDIFQDFSSKTEN